MKFGVPKFRLAGAVGVNLTETGVAWSLLEKGPFGVRQSAAGEEPCSKHEWPDVLRRVLEQAVGASGSAMSVVIGLPASHTFFATLPTGAKGASAEALLAGHHCCTSIPPAELSADMLPVKVNGKTFAAIAASRRKELQALIDVPRKLNFRSVRVEPAPWALLRTCSPNRPGRLMLRLLIDGRHLIAILVSGSQPLLWRSMELLEEGSADLIVSLVRTFESYAAQQLVVPGIDAIVLEGTGTDDLALKLEADLGERFSAVEGLGPTAVAAARGLALGGLERDKPAPDLARSLAPPPHLADLVPRGEVALLGSVVICMGLWLWGSGTVVQNKAMRAEDENTKNAMLKIDDVKLKDEKKTLSAEVQAVNTFLSSRILWTEYLTQLSGRIPTGVKFVTLKGEYELMTGGEKGEKKAKKSLELSFSAMVPPNMSAPPEVDDLLEGIRSAPAIARDFPDIKLTTLRVNKSADSNASLKGDPATFTVTCLPKGRSAAEKQTASSDAAKATADPVTRSD